MRSIAAITPNSDPRPPTSPSPMPPAQLTHEQLLARDTRDVSIGVSAGAGCGKTHVLTSRLRTHAAEAGLDPQFGVLEQAEADLLLQETMDDVLRQRLAEQDSDTMDLAAEFRQLAQLKDRIALLVDQRHRPAFNRWLAA